MFTVLPPWVRPAIWAVVVGGVLVYTHHAGVTSGKAEVQAKFDKYAEAVDALASKKAAEATAKEQAAEVANAKTVEQYQAEITKSSLYGADLALRLRRALAQVRSHPVPQSPDQPVAAEPSPEASRSDAIANAVGDAAAECRRNADQLDALIQELTPQL